MIEFFRFKQIKILGNELKYPENRVGCFESYYGFKIARLVKDPEILVIIKNEDGNEDEGIIRQSFWHPIIAGRSAEKFYKSENRKNWNILYSKNSDLLCKIHDSLPEVTGPTDLGEFEPIVSDRFYLLV
jgi:hypothetical protein